MFPNRISEKHPHEIVTGSPTYSHAHPRARVRTHTYTQNLSTSISISLFVKKCEREVGEPRENIQYNLSRIYKERKDKLYYKKFTRIFQKKEISAH